MFTEAALFPDPYDGVSSFEYFKLFATTEMLQTMEFEPNQCSYKILVKPGRSLVLSVLLRNQIQTVIQTVNG